MSCEYRLLLFLIFFDPITVCDLPSSPPPPLVPTVTYGYLPKLSTTHLPAYYHLPYWYQYWWFWLCLQTLGTLCPSRLVPLALFGLTEPSDPLRFVRPQPKSPPFSLNSSSSSSSIVRVFRPSKEQPPKSNCSTEFIPCPKRFFILRFFFFFFFFFFTLLLFFRHPALLIEPTLSLSSIYHHLYYDRTAHHTILPPAVIPTTLS